MVTVWGKLKSQLCEIAQISLCAILDDQVRWPHHYTNKGNSITSKTEFKSSKKHIFETIY